MFSIDLAREVELIARRQHLNAVQDLVLLLRRVLRAGAREVRISRDGDDVMLDALGARLDDDEARLLEVVLSPSAPDDARQAALSTLERAHGIALLSLFVEKDAVSVSSTFALTGGGGRAVRVPATDSSSTTIRYTSPRALWRDEKREIAFYARHAHVPIFVDGRALRRRPLDTLLPRDALVRASLRFTDDNLLAALVSPASATKVRLFDHGIFYGVRARSTSERLPLDVVVDSRAQQYDENYRAAVVRAHDEILRAEREVLTLLARRGAALDVHARRMLVALLTLLSDDELPGALKDAPVVVSLAGNWLSFHELRRRVLADGALFYAPPPRFLERLRDRMARVPLSPRARALPVLDDDTAHRLARRLGARALVVTRAERMARDADAGRPTSRGLPPVDGDGSARGALAETTGSPLRALVDALNAGGATRFEVVDGPSSSIVARSSSLSVRLGAEDPLVLRAARAALDDELVRAMLRVRLASHARGDARTP